MIVDELVNDGSFRVIERKRLDAMLAEQNFSNSERADPSAKTLAQLGKVLGVKYLVVGSVTKFGTEKSNKSFSGGGWGSAFGVGLGRDVEGQGERRDHGPHHRHDDRRDHGQREGRWHVEAQRLAARRRRRWRRRWRMGGIAFGASDFRDTILGEATEMAVKATATKLVAAKSRLE